MSTRKHKIRKRKKKKDSVLIWKLLTVILSIGIIISSYFAFTSNAQNTAILMSQGCSFSDAQKVMDFINQNLVRTGTKAFLTNYSSENVCWITTEYQGNLIPVILKEGNILVLPSNIIDIEKTEMTIEEQRRESQEVQKSENPNVKLFIMSFCPYGREAAKAMEPVYQLLKNKSDIEVHYVIYPSDLYKGKESQYCIDQYCSMHGVTELKENIREICIEKIYGKDKYWEYMKDQLEKCNINNIESCWKEVASNHGIDINKIENCLNTNAIKYLKEEYDLNTKYGVSASPTILINEKRYTGSRTPEAFKNAICNAFIDPPEECSQTLSSTTSRPIQSGSCG